MAEDIASINSTDIYGDLNAVPSSESNSKHHTRKCHLANNFSSHSNNTSMPEDHWMDDKDVANLAPLPTASSQALIKCSNFTEGNVFNVVANRAMLETQVWKTQMALYDELIAAEVEEREEKLKRAIKYEELWEEVKKLTLANREKEAKISELILQNTNLKKNICSLYKTAKTEIERKDSVLLEVNKKLDRLQFLQKKASTSHHLAYENQSNKCEETQKEKDVHYASHKRKNSLDHHGNLRKRRESHDRRKDYNTEKSYYHRKTTAKSSGTSHKEDLNFRNGSSKSKKSSVLKYQDRKFKTRHSQNYGGGGHKTYAGQKDSKILKKSEKRSDDKREHSHVIESDQNAGMPHSSDHKEREEVTKQPVPKKNELSMNSCQPHQDASDRLCEKEVQPTNHSSNILDSEQVQQNSHNNDDCAKDDRNINANETIVNLIPSVNPSTGYQQSSSTVSGVENEKGGMQVDELSCPLSERVVDKDVVCNSKQENSKIELKSNKVDLKLSDLPLLLESKQSLDNDRTSTNVNGAFETDQNDIEMENLSSPLSESYENKDTINHCNSKENHFEIFQDKTTTNALFFGLLPTEMRQSFMEYEQKLIINMNKLKQSFVNYYFNHSEGMTMNISDPSPSEPQSSSAEQLSKTQNMCDKKDTDSPLFFFEQIDDKNTSNVLNSSHVQEKSVSLDEVAGSELNPVKEAVESTVIAVDESARNESECQNLSLKDNCNLLTDDPLSSLNLKCKSVCSQDDDGNTDSTKEIPSHYRELFLAQEKDAVNKAGSTSQLGSLFPQTVNELKTNGPISLKNVSSNSCENNNQKSDATKRQRAHYCKSLTQESYHPSFSSVYYRRQLLKAALEEKANSGLTKSTKEDIAKLYRYRSAKVPHIVKRKGDIL